MKWTENENENLTQEEAEDRKWVLVEKGGSDEGRSGGEGGQQRVGVYSHCSSLHGVEMILLTPEL